VRLSQCLPRAQVAAMSDSYTAPGTSRHAIVPLPEQAGQTHARQVREELLVINRDAAELIADMTTSVSFDRPGAAAGVRPCQRADTSGVQLQPVAAARVLPVSGLGRLIPIYPSWQAATTTTTTTAAAAAVPVTPMPGGPYAAQPRSPDRTSARGGTP
jgi:hypothetical protein